MQATLYYQDTAKVYTATAVFVLPPYTNYMPMVQRN
jgi:hypothetical protein